MKKFRSVLAVLMVMALLASLSVLTASAAEPEKVSKTLNFETLNTTTGGDSAPDYAEATAAIKGLGAEDASNLYISSCYSPFVTAKGYAGEGYFIIKLAAGEDMVFDGAPTVDLDYRITNADPLGKIKIEGSLDGTTYYDFGTLSESTGASQTNTATKSATITLNGGENAPVVWVKITMANWSGPDGCAVETVTVSGNVKEDPNADVETKTLNFGSMTPTTGGDNDPDYAEAVAAIKALGAEDASNLYIGSCYTPFLVAKGWAGEGYFVMKLEAGEGKVFAENTALKLAYRQSDTTEERYIKILVSTDGETYTEAKVLTENTGAGFTEECKKTIDITLDGTADVGTVWVKFVMFNHASPDACGVDSVTLSALTKEAPADPGPGENNQGSGTTGTTPPPTGDIVSVVAAAGAVCAMGILFTVKKIKED